MVRSLSVVSRGPGSLPYILIGSLGILSPVVIGTAFPFALKLVEIVLGRAKRDEIVGPMVFPDSSYP